MDQQPFEISKRWLHEHKTVRGGWTRKQVEAIGETWPLVKGWTFRAVGRLVTEQQRRLFESFGHMGQMRARERQARLELDVRDMAHEHRRLVDKSE